MMRFWGVASIIFSVDVILCQWADRVFLVDHLDYFHRVMTETVHELEEKGWSNLKLDDNSVTVDQQMYKWHVTGNTNYTNGFLVSIEKIDISDVTQGRYSPTVNGVVQTFAIVQGTMNLRDFKIGYDVLAQLGDDGDHTYTGTFVYTLASFQFRIEKNLHTQEITAQQSLEALSRGPDEMDYMPASHLTEVISRTYVPSRASTSVENWGRDHILPIILDVATNRISFPKVCLDCR